MIRPVKTGAQVKPISHRIRAGSIVLLLAVALGGCGTLGKNSMDAEMRDIVEVSGREAKVLATRAINEGRYADAKKFLEFALESDPTDIQAKLLVAELHLVTGMPAMAVPSFDELTSLPEVKARALQGLGVSLILVGRGDLAVDRLTEAVALDDGLWRSWNALGSYYDTKQDWEAANRAYDMAMAANSGSAIIHNNQGFSYFLQGRSEEAITLLSEAVRIDRNLAPARLNLRLAYASSGKYAHALSGVADRDMSKALNNVGYIALMRGDVGNAEAYLTRAMDEDAAFNRTAWRNLGYLKTLQELSTEAAALTD